MPRPAPVKAGPLRSEQIILFRIGDQLFALSSSSVQEVRGADSLSGGAHEISAPGIDKVRQFVRRGAKTLLQALPLSFCDEERHWYRGLTALDQTVVPVVRPEGFLSDDELMLLDRSLPPAELSTEETEVEEDTDFDADLN